MKTNLILTTESAITQIEKVMLSLSPSDSRAKHRQYLKGYIDSLEETGTISAETREILYSEYGS